MFSKQYQPIRDVFSRRILPFTKKFVLLGDLLKSYTMASAKINSIGLFTKGYDKGGLHRRQHHLGISGVKEDTLEDGVLPIIPD